MDEIQAVERVLGVFDAAEHMNAAARAGMALDGGGGIDDLELVPVGRDRTLSRETTAMTANIAPAGFQHLVQPQAWLKAVCAPMETVTGSRAHLQTSVPPAKPFAAGAIP